MAKTDPYSVLGVPKDASEAAIKAAYRKEAKKYHPDLNPGNKAAEEKFKALSAAHELLSDPDKRARFDRGEIDAEGQEVRPERPSYRSYAEGSGGGRYSGFTEDDLGDIFGEYFSARAGSNRPRRGRDRRYTLTVSFLDSVTGAQRRLTLPDGKTLDVRVPPGIETGQILRLSGQGDPGLNGGPDGDALIEIEVSPHHFFRRDGNDIHLDLPVTLEEAVLGARIPVPTPGGEVTMTIPKHSDTGTRLRLRGRGVAAHGGQPAGDAYVTLKVVLGKPDEALESFLREHPARPFDPRASLRGGN
jgi:DnaJ-class molecular chaperone